MQQIDLELALTEGSADLMTIQENLPLGFYIEDRSDRGWGLVIRTSQESSDDFSSALNEFFNQLLPFKDLIRRHKGILRAGIYYDTATCTVKVDSSVRFTDFNLCLEISSYPVSDEET